MAAILNRARHKSGRSYVDYQVQVARGHLIPLLEREGVSLDTEILDVGCGTGGFVIALAQELGRPVSGVDIRADRIAVAKETARELGVKARFDVSDVIKDSLSDSRFGLLLLRDVVEHLGDLEAVLRGLRPLLDPAGRLYVTFPPWRGPYAGHQHNARSAVRFMPYLHALSSRLFLKLLHRWESERDVWLADERQICANRLTRKKFEQAVSRCGWRISYRQTYFLRPAFARMGLPTVANGPIGRLPLIGESVSTACEYLLQLD